MEKRPKIQVKLAKIWNAEYFFVKNSTTPPLTTDLFTVNETISTKYRLLNLSTAGEP